jgi:hypothetical protein
VTNPLTGEIIAETPGKCVPPTPTPGGGGDCCKEGESEADCEARGVGRDSGGFLKRCVTDVV